MIPINPNSDKAPDLSQKDFWTGIKLADLPPSMKMGLSLSFMLFVSGTILTLFGRMPWIVTAMSWVLMTGIIFASIRLSQKYDKHRK